MSESDDGGTDYEFSDHARYELGRRGIDLEMVRQVVADPQQTFEVRKGRIVAQSKVRRAGGTYLLRVFVDTDRPKRVIVTAYLTSKVEKYWRDAP
jgi:hypothetical protein